MIKARDYGGGVGDGEERLDIISDSATWCWADERVG